MVKRVRKYGEGRMTLARRPATDVLAEQSMRICKPEVLL